MGNFFKYISFVFLGLLLLLIILPIISGSYCTEWVYADSGGDFAGIDYGQQKGGIFCNFMNLYIIDELQYSLGVHITLAILTILSFAAYILIKFFRKKKQNIHAS